MSLCISNGNPTGNPIHVYFVGDTQYRDGFTNIADLVSIGNTVVRAVGWVLHEPASGKPTLVGPYMDKTGDTEKGTHGR